ncbi:gamma-glutamyltranspeptidase [Lasallia pustulata]|uniref:Gamma-glutamyltranspeptidase n=1 Tax=Lasallia pustulata TaxID=136370 RepID=A0A1W5DE49_9LECA|nr:gamma-glutamyltranspeptidase [Lasallia pustulata]
MPLNARAIYPSADPRFVNFPSRRSVVHSVNGMVACTQPLAAQAGQRILRAGGNAADAAVAVAAALNITEPSSTGIGGDIFCLFYNADTKKVHALNGSGRAGANASLEGIRKDLGLESGQVAPIPMTSVHAVTVPGAPAGWVDTVEKFGSGKLSMDQILTPAIELGEEGFPVSELSSYFWKSSEQRIRDASPNSGEMLKPDKKAKDSKRAPRRGELFQNPTLANTFRLLAKHGKKGFYEGSVAEALIQVVQDLGGHLTLEDLKDHAELGSQEVDAIRLRFNGQNVGNIPSHLEQDEQAQSHVGEGVDVWEHPPNGQGIVALMALGILEELERTGKVRKFQEHEHNCAEYLHALIESLRIAFADANWWVTDPDVEKVPTQEMISRPYLAERAKLFDPKKASGTLDHGSPAHNHCDTVYFAVTDKFGNGISFINSNYGGFGTCIVPKGCGFTLQNRGANFVLKEGHPNVIAPKKRPYHTIIPAMITNPADQSLHTVYGVMGGFMQPQGHVQVLLNMLTFKYDPQAALDAPRFCIGAGTPDQGKMDDRTVYLEEGISEDVVKELRALGHEPELLAGYRRGLFGRGQVIRCHVEGGKHVSSAGSDPRGDGAAFPA